MSITLFWEQVGTGILDQTAPLNLGNIGSIPGATSPIELKITYATNESITKLINCGLNISPYGFIYPTNGNGVQTDVIELQQWGDLIGESNKAGFLINMNKEDDYPDNSWIPFNSVDGISEFSPLQLLSTAVQLSGGGYHNVHGEIPLAAAVYFKVKVVAPVGVAVGHRYASLVLDFSKPAVS
jgi:hypothetical protein